MLAGRLCDDTARYEPVGVSFGIPLGLAQVHRGGAEPLLVILSGLLKDEGVCGTRPHARDGGGVVLLPTSQHLRIGDCLDGLVGEDSVMRGIAHRGKALDETVREGEVAPLHKKDDEESQQTQIALRGNSLDGLGLEGHEVPGHRRPPALQLLDGPDGRPTAFLQVMIVHRHAGRVPQVVIQRGKDFQRGCRGGPLQGCGKISG